MSQACLPATATATARLPARPLAEGGLCTRLSFSLPGIIGLGLRESELEEEEEPGFILVPGPETPHWTGSLVWNALGATLGIPVTRCHPSSVCACVHVLCGHMCAHLSKGSRDLLCSLNLILPKILQASPIYFPVRKDKTQKGQWTGPGCTAG